MRVLAVAACMLALTLSGCLVEEPSGLGAEETTPTAPRAEPTREEGEVTVTFDPLAPGFVATQQIVLSNDVPEGLALAMHAQTENGRLQVRDHERAAYGVRAHMWAEGGTEEEARAHLASMRLMHTDEGQDEVEVRVWVETEDFDPLGVPLVNLGSLDRGVEMDISVPRLLPELRLGTTNGDVDVALVAERLVVDTTNGDISASVRARDLVLDTTNGDIFLKGTPQGSGRWVLDSTNGDLEADLTTTDNIGYDLRLDTTNGDIEVDVDDVQKQDEGHYRTSDWSSRKVQVRLDGDTTNGDITIRG